MTIFPSFQNCIIGCIFFVVVLVDVVGFFLGFLSCINKMVLKFVNEFPQSQVLGRFTDVFCILTISPKRGHL